MILHIRRYHPVLKKWIIITKIYLNEIGEFNLSRSDNAVHVSGQFTLLFVVIGHVPLGEPSAPLTIEHDNVLDLPRWFVSIIDIDRKGGGGIPTIVVSSVKFDF